MLREMITDTSGNTARLLQEMPGQDVDLGERVKKAAKHLGDVVRDS